jgi:hypothetical protein
MLRRRYYKEMKEPHDRTDICKNIDCTARYCSLIPLFNKEWPFEQIGLICGWCFEVYKETENEDHNN